MRTILLISLLIICNNSICQDIKGVWISSHSIVEYNEDFLIKEFDEISGDSVSVMPIQYHQTNVVIDFISNTKGIFRAANSDEIKFRYTTINNTVQIKIDSLTLNGDWTDDELILTDNSELRHNTKIVLHRAAPSLILKEDSSIFNHAKAITFSSVNPDLRLNVLNDKPQAITYEHDERFHTSIAEIFIDYYKGNLFYIVSDHDYMHYCVFHIKRKKDNTYRAQTNWFEFINPMKPTKIEFSVTIDSLYKQTECSELQSQITGTWLCNDSTILSCAESIGPPYQDNIERNKNIALELQFMANGEFHQTLIKNKLDKTVTSGKWELSKNGKFLILSEDESYGEQASIIKLDNSQLILEMDISCKEFNMIVNKEIAFFKTQ